MLPKMKSVLILRFQKVSGLIVYMLYDIYVGIYSMMGIYVCIFMGGKLSEKVLNIIQCAKSLSFTVY